MDLPGSWSRKRRPDAVTGEENSCKRWDLLLWFCWDGYCCRVLWYIYPSPSRSTNKRGSYHSLIDYGVLLCTETYKTLYPLESTTSRSRLWISRSINWSCPSAQSTKYYYKVHIYIFISTMTLCSISTMVLEPLLQGTSVCHPSLSPVVIHIPAKDQNGSTEYELQSTTQHNTESERNRRNWYFLLLLQIIWLPRLSLFLILYAYIYIPQSWPGWNPIIVVQGGVEEGGRRC